FCLFFQAEDGIRDDLVTGVQTCALPISTVVIAIPAKIIRIATKPAPHRLISGLVLAYDFECLNNFIQAPRCEFGFRSAASIANKAAYILPQATFGSWSTS